MYKLIPHEIILVSSIPNCDFCQMVGKVTPGPYDFATKQGPWAHGCEEHWKAHRAATTLGTGRGQFWVTEDQVAPNVPGRLTAPQILLLKEELRIAVENGTMDDEAFFKAAQRIGLSEAEMEELFS